MWPPSLRLRLAIVRIPETINHFVVKVKPSLWYLLLGSANLYNEKSSWTFVTEDVSGLFLHNQSSKTAFFFFFFFKNLRPIISEFSPLTFICPWNQLILEWIYLFSVPPLSMQQVVFSTRYNSKAFKLLSIDYRLNKHAILPSVIEVPLLPYISSQNNKIIYSYQSTIFNFSLSYLTWQSHCYMS